MKRLLFVLPVLLAILAACGQPIQAVAPVVSVAAGPTPQVVRLLNLDAVVAAAPQPQPTVTRPAPTFTSPAPTDLPASSIAQPTGVQPAASTATPACTNRVEFVRHLSINDNTTLAAGAYFAKVWRVRNVGTCTWTTAYKLVWLSGDAWSAVTTFPITAETAPGATLDINILLMAPPATGSYTGAWLLEDPAGQRFGAGPAFDQPLTLAVNIKGAGDKQDDPFEIPTDCG